MRPIGILVFLLMLMLMLMLILLQFIILILILLLPHCNSVGDKEGDWLGEKDD
jgi:hypothetical protein